MDTNTLLLLLGLAFLIVLVSWLFSSRTVEYSPEKIQALAEALYQTGYDDQKAGRPKKLWDMDEISRLSRFHREFLEKTELVYQHGWQDALEGKPSLVEEIRENRNEQLRILGEMKVLLDGVITSTKQMTA